MESIEKKKPIDLSLYLCTDRGLMSTETLEEAVEQAILGGCTVVQLREKDCSSLDFYQCAKNIKTITDKYDVPLIINDRVDIAVAIDAAGVHVGQSDLPASVVRNIIGPDKIVGVSTANVKEAQKAKQDGADYIGVGAVFTTSTKSDTRAVSYETLKAIHDEVGIPMVAIGGIQLNNLNQLSGSGIDGVAVISAIIAKENIKEAAKNMREQVKATLNL